MSTHKLYCCAYCCKLFEIKPQHNINTVYVDELACYSCINITMCFIEIITIIDDMRSVEEIWHCIDTTNSYTTMYLLAKFVQFKDKQKITVLINHDAPNGTRVYIYGPTDYSLSNKEIISLLTVCRVDAHIRTFHNYSELRSYIIDENLKCMLEYDNAVHQVLFRRYKKLRNSSV